jgi:hypothetical protein
MLTVIHILILFKANSVFEDSRGAFAVPSSTPAASSPVKHKVVEASSVDITGVEG